MNPEPRKQSRLKQLGLFICIGFAAALSMLFTSDWKEHVGFVVPIGILISLGLVLAMLIPSIYLEYIRKRKATGQHAALHRVLFFLYWFPFFPWAFAACIFGALYLGGVIK